MVNIKNFLRSKSLLWILPIISGLSLIILSYISIVQIEQMKKQVDKIYFGNFIQTSYLHSIENLLNENIIYYSLKKYYKIKKNNNQIKKLWSYYKNSYKTKKEQIAINKVDDKIRLTFKIKSIKNYSKAIKYLKKLINYEMGIAQIERKKFLIQYENKKQGLYFVIGFIIFVTILLIIIVALITHTNYKNLENLTRQYKVESITDGMTKLYNKKFFNEMLDTKIIQMATDNNIFVAFIMVDIDNFKKYNDTYGHDKGDDTLIAVAKILKQVLYKSNCFVFRLGGEEFGALIVDINRYQLEKILEILRFKVKNLNIEHINNPPSGVVTISLGATLIKPNDSRSPRDIYISADKMLYKAKENGRNRFFIDG